MSEHKYGEPTRMEHRGPEPFFLDVARNFQEIGRIINASFPAPPDRGYVGNRCGWYPEKPKRKKRNTI